jgi:hypothetical protein
MHSIVKVIEKLEKIELLIRCERSAGLKNMKLREIKDKTINAVAIMSCRSEARVVRVHIQLSKDRRAN